MTVYVPQEVMYKNENGFLVPKFHTHLAEAYGELHVLLPYGDVALAPQPMVAKLRHALRNFSDEDYILPTGDPATIGAAIAVAADFNNGRVKLLRWRGKVRKYITLKMNLRGQRYD